MTTRVVDKIEIKSTGREYRDDFDSGLVCDSYLQESMAPHQHGFSPIRDYTCYVQLGVSFRCNDVQLPDAKVRAKKQLVFELYREQQSILHCLENAICSGDKREALNMLVKLRGSMEP